MIAPWQQAQTQGLGNNAPTGMQTGVPPQQGNVNPLAQMLAQQGPQYKPGDTTWGQSGDRLLRYTPQEGNQRGGGGTGGGGAGGLPPINPGEDSMAYMLRIGMSQADADAALAMSKANPNLTFQQIMAQMHGGGGGGTGALPGSTPTSLRGGGVDWAKLQSAMGAPPPAPPGAPATNTAMEKLKSSTGPVGALPAWDGKPVDYSAVLPYKAAWDQLRNNPPGKDAGKAASDAWYQKVTDAQNAYVEMQKRTGLGPGGYVGS
jgi:hypothetical protein